MPGDPGCRRSGRSEGLCLFCLYSPFCSRQALIINVPFELYFLNPAGLLKAFSAVSALFCLVAPQLARLRWVQHPAPDSVGTSSFLLFSQSVMGGSVPQPGIQCEGYPS